VPLKYFFLGFSAKLMGQMMFCWLQQDLGMMIYMILAIGFVNCVLEQ
jgi:hypothetical protein